jgi:hypothetical protein
MRTYVVTEGPADVVLLKRVLQGRTRETPEIIAAGGKSAVISFAQSLMVSRHVPVASVLDADTVDTQLADEQERIYSDRLAAYAHGVPCAVFLAVPELEHLLFESPSILKRELGVEIPQKDAQEATVKPGDVLERMIRRSSMNKREEFYARLSDLSTEELARLPLIARLIRFLKRPHSFDISDRRPANVA